MLTNFANCFILDVRLGSEYASVSFNMKNTKYILKLKVVVNLKVKETCRHHLPN